MMKVVGINRTFQALETCASRSSSTGKSTGTLPRNPLMRASPSPMLTANIATGVPSRDFFSRLNEGISSRQGSHQVAQKLRITTLPR